MKPSLIIEQKITLFVNQYRVYEADAQGNKGQLKAFAQQKRMALKERINFYRDEQKSAVVFYFQAEKVMDLASRYRVCDEHDQEIGSFKKEFKQSLINSTWTIFDGDKPTMTVSESNLYLALARRFAGYLPIIGGVVDIIMAFLRYHFVFKDTSGKAVGMYRKKTLFRDHYELSLTDDVTADWRLLAAISVALDALQSR